MLARVTLSPLLLISLVLWAGTATRQADPTLVLLAITATIGHVFALIMLWID
jgi:hypothetical protein